jgi:hypothetical protein
LDDDCIFYRHTKVVFSNPQSQASTLSTVPMDISYQFNRLLYVTATTFLTKERHVLIYFPDVDKVHALPTMCYATAPNVVPKFVTAGNVNWFAKLVRSRHDMTDGLEERY